MAREVVKESILDSLQLLSEVSAYLQNVNVGKIDLPTFLRYLNRRFGEFGNIGKVDQILKLMEEVKSK